MQWFPPVMKETADKTADTWRTQNRHTTDTCEQTANNTTRHITRHFLKMRLIDLPTSFVPTFFSLSYWYKGRRDHTNEMKSTPRLQNQAAENQKNSLSSSHDVISNQADDRTNASLQNNQSDIIWLHIIDSGLKI